MKAYQAALLGAALIRGAVSHQVHGILLVNGTASPAWKYVRNVAYSYDPGETWPKDNDYPKTSPLMDMNHPDITCGRRAFDWAATTETADVLAGSEVGFRVSYTGSGPMGTFYHPGPGFVFLSRAPDDNLENYRGDGDWFKIAYAGPVANDEWALWGRPDFNFTIPATTPPGKYLMRIEHMMPTNYENYTQFYVNCAHVNIIGPGGGTPTDFAKFPGTYNFDMQGFWLPKDMLVNGGYFPDEELRLLDYVPPEPAVWSG